MNPKVGYTEHGDFFGVHTDYTKELKKLSKKSKVYVTQPVKVTKNDVLLIIDFQYDFINKSFLEGGTETETEAQFPVGESESIISPITKITEKFSDKGSLIIATRDYHPPDHHSFFTNTDNNGISGPWPPHCLIGTVGSMIVEPVYKILKDYDNGFVAFKGFNTQVDSYGAFKYPNKEDNERWGRTKPLRMAGCTKQVSENNFVVGEESCSKIPWTSGAYLVRSKDEPTKYMKFGTGWLQRLKHAIFSPFQNRLELKNLEHYWLEENYDITKEDLEQQLKGSPIESDFTVKDVLENTRLTSVKGFLDAKDVKKTAKIFLTGLVGDICLMDTAINARVMGYENVYIIVNLTRFGKFPPEAPFVSASEISYPGKDENNPNGMVKPYFHSPYQFFNVCKHYRIKLIDSSNLKFV